jgi:DNA-binding NarL/FixJ family response regulator
VSITIAIVEDLDEVREGLKNFITLSTDFIVVGDYKSGEEACAKLPDVAPDIVIMDINLPGISGIECIRQVKDKSPSTQFMMFTVYETDEKVFEALKAGASGYLLKNTGLLQIVESIKDLHQGGSPMSANIARKLVNLFHTTSKESATIDVLSNRENEVLQLLSKGLLYKEIADKLQISTGTVRQHIHKIYEKLHVQNRTEALNKAFGK